ncbi:MULTISPECIES: HNH endonuclease [unclassified Streptococcus]|uniref:HNH endonuclease n=1 Tax=unclassified Streptococcus TaxID=2608887 RepID=UPI00359EC305
MRKTRLKALERDHFQCVWCRKDGILTTKRLEADHIEELDKRPDLAYSLDNLRTLCRDCHNKRHNRYQRKKRQWQDERFEW